eukprot:418170-Amphidinium_carterae.2
MGHMQVGKTAVMFFVKRFLHMTYDMDGTNGHEGLQLGRIVKSACDAHHKTSEKLPELPGVQVKRCGSKKSHVIPSSALLNFKSVDHRRRATSEGPGFGDILTNEIWSAALRAS